MRETIMMEDEEECEVVYTVALAFLNEHKKVELSVWTYKSQQDAAERYASIMTANHHMGERSPILSVVNQLNLVFDNYSESILAEGPSPDKVN